MQCRAPPCQLAQTAATSAPGDVSQRDAQCCQLVPERRAVGAARHAARGGHVGGVQCHRLDGAQPPRRILGRGLQGLSCCGQVLTEAHQSLHPGCRTVLRGADQRPAALFRPLQPVREQPTEQPGINCLRRRCWTWGVWRNAKASLSESCCNSGPPANLKAQLPPLAAQPGIGLVSPPRALICLVVALIAVGFALWPPARPSCNRHPLTPIGSER